MHYPTPSALSPGRHFASDGCWLGRGEYCARVWYAEEKTRWWGQSERNVFRSLFQSNSWSVCYEYDSVSVINIFFLELHRPNSHPPLFIRQTHESIWFTLAFWKITNHYWKSFDTMHGWYVILGMSKCNIEEKFEKVTKAHVVSDGIKVFYNNKNHWILIIILDKHWTMYLHFCHCHNEVQ